MKTVKYVILTICIIGFTGCYTQFVTLEDRYPEQPGQSVDDSSVTSEEQDTVVIKDREYCYWERGFLGDWELRCYETRYPNNYYSYYNRPWWYSGSSFHNYSCSCPYHVTFHPNCEYCWYYCDQYNRNHPYGYGYPHGYSNKNNIHGNSGGGGSSGNNNAIHTKTPRPSIRPQSNSISQPGTAPGASAAIPAENPPQGITEEAINNGTPLIIENTNPNSADVKPMPRELNPNGMRKTIRPMTTEQNKENVPSGNNNNPVKRDPQPYNPPNSHPDPGMGPGPGNQNNSQPANNAKDNQWPRKRRSVR